jgi:hypothetical protein
MKSFLPCSADHVFVFSGADEDDEDLSREQWQEACWQVISAYFNEKGMFAIKTVCDQ